MLLEDGEGSSFADIGSPAELRSLNAAPFSHRLGTTDGEAGRCSFLLMVAQRRKQHIGSQSMARPHWIAEQDLEEKMQFGSSHIALKQKNHWLGSPKGWEINRLL